MSASTLRGACGGPLLLPRSLKLVGLLASVVPLHQAREARGGCWGSQDEQGLTGVGPPAWHSRPCTWHAVSPSS